MDGVKYHPAVVLHDIISEIPGRGAQRFDSSEPLHHGVEEEAHSERKSRV
jgi:hypothetical protein